MLLLVSLALIGGCGLSAKLAGHLVKCPACGYEFKLENTTGNQLTGRAPG